MAVNDPSLVAAESQFRNLKPTFSGACVNGIERGAALLRCFFRVRHRAPALLVGCVAIIGSSRLALEPQAVSQCGDERETALLPPLFGKTTLLRTLIGALRATAGTVTLNGTDITRAAPHARARLGMAYVP